MLDSSPVALPVRRPLKRSASTASLPTPPRTHRKHARGRSRGSCDSDSDEHAVLSSDDEELDSAHKKRRTGEAVANANEEAFWLSGSAGLNSTGEVGLTAVDSSSRQDHSAPLLYRRKHAQQQAQADVAPVSPPPSHRRAVVATVNANSTRSPPTTPKTRSATRRALRDSPDNPFLATPEKVVEDSDSPSASSANPSPHTPNNHEKPTITYVFRGVRRVYQNPLFNHAEGRPYSPPPASKLPIDDPDFSPAINCTPKLLFPGARRGKKTASRVSKNKKRARSPSVSGDDADADGADILPMKLKFGEPDKKKATKNMKTLDQELKTAGEPLSI